MTVTVPLVALIGVVVYIAYRCMGLRFWHALIAAIFGFLLAATTAAPEIRNILTELANWINK
jgi:ABC-type phosphate transport system auxiliary subunit